MTESSGGNAVYVGVVSQVLGLLLMSGGHMLWGAPSTFSSSALSSPLPTDKVTKPVQTFPWVPRSSSS